jgi:hypothetical protein
MRRMGPPSYAATCAPIDQAVLRKWQVAVAGVLPLPASNLTRGKITVAELGKYHQPADRLENSWNFDGMIEDAQLAMLSAWLVAQADAMPTWRPGDEFEAARKRALAAVGSP